MVFDGLSNDNEITYRFSNKYEKIEKNRKKLIVMCFYL
jgi:hypothetical protein